MGNIFDRSDRILPSHVADLIQPMVRFHATGRQLVPEGEICIAGDFDNGDYPVAHSRTHLLPRTVG